MRESDREREALEQQAAADFLRLAHHAAGFWRACATKACRRVRACRGDVDECGARRFPEGWAWVRGVLQALRDGARPRAAMRAADRQVIAGETVGDFGRQAGTGTFTIEYPGLGDSIEIAAVVGKRGRRATGPARQGSQPSPRPRIPVARQSVGP